MRRALLPPSALGVLAILLSACSKQAPTPARFDELLAPLGAGQHEPVCQKERDGERVVVNGYLALPSSISVEDGKLELELCQSYQDGECVGRSVSVKAREGDDVSFKLVNQKATFSGGRSGTKAEIAATTVHTSGGDKQLGDNLAATLEIDVIEHFQTKEITACTFSIVELKPL